jgi:hypothetical protein
MWRAWLLEKIFACLWVASSGLAYGGYRYAQKPSAIATSRSFSHPFARRVIGPQSSRSSAETPADHSTAQCALDMMRRGHV